jgi:hypothetical protein
VLDGVETGTCFTFRCTWSCSGHCRLPPTEEHDAPVCALKARNGTFRRVIDLNHRGTEARRTAWKDGSRWRRRPLSSCR